MGKFEEAITSYDNALEIHYYYADTHFFKGASLYYLGRFQEASKSFDQVIEIDDNLPYAYYWKAAALVALGNTEGALVELELAFELDPELKSVAASDDAFKVLRNNRKFLQ